MKSMTDPDKWRKGYTEAYESEPTQDLFHSNANEAVKNAEELVGFAKSVGHIRPVALDLTTELLRRLQQYRDSIPAYFSS